MKINSNIAIALTGAWLLAAGVPIACADDAVKPAAADPETTPVADAKPPAADTDKPVATPVVPGLAGSYLSGQFARNNGHSDDAISNLTQVHHDQPDNIEIASQLQMLLLQQGQIDQAIVLAQDIRQAGGRDALSDLMVTLHEIQDNHPERAAELLNAALLGGSSQLWQPLILGWLNASQHKLTKPLTMDAFKTDLGRATPLVRYHLALINAYGGFPKAATEDFKAAIDTPRDPSQRIMRQLVLFYIKNGQPEALTPLVTAWRDAHAGADDTDNVTQIAAPRDGVAEVLFTMGGVMLSAGASNDAALYLQLAFYVNPDLGEAAMALGDTYSDLQQYDRANAYYGKVKASSRLYERAQLRVAINDERRGKLDAALTRLDALSKQTPGGEEALVTRGDLLRLHQRYGEAIAAYNVAIGRAGTLSASYWPVLFARGACYERMGKWAEAEKDLRQALELSPDQPDVLNYLGYGMLERGEQVDQARAMIEQAVKQRPDDAQIVDSMGWALYLQGNYDDAVGYIEKAVELLPGDPTVNDHLGDVYWRVGRKTEARFQWERSLSFSPDEKLSGSLHKKLKDGLPPATIAQSAVKAVSSATP